MKKVILFSISFLTAYFTLQIFSGMLLTVFYTPKSAWDIFGLTSEAELVATAGIVPVLIVTLLAAIIAFGVTKLFTRKSHR